MRLYLSSATDRYAIKRVNLQNLKKNYINLLNILNMTVISIIPLFLLIHCRSPLRIQTQARPSLSLSENYTCRQNKIIINFVSFFIQTQGHRYAYTSWYSSSTASNYSRKKQINHWNFILINKIVSTQLHHSKNTNHLKPTSLHLESQKYFNYIMPSGRKTLGILPSHILYTSERIK